LSNGVNLEWLNSVGPELGFNKFLSDTGSAIRGPRKIDNSKYSGSFSGPSYKRRRY
jgi:hypothetical protein